ncbi:MAG: hypothetical protein ACE5JG_05610 [Planctomycetota bacterium]
MRRLAPILLAAALLGGCRSSKRDYLANNRQGLAHLRESLREGNRLRRQSLHDALSFGERRRRNRKHRRESLSFLFDRWHDSRWHELAETWRWWRDGRREARRRRGEQMWFGFADEDR